MVADALSRLGQNESQINDENKLYVVQTRSKKQNEVSEDKEKYCNMEEKNNLPIDIGKFNHAFYFFNRESCSMHRKLEHKLKMKINIPKNFREYELFSINTDRTVIKIDEVIRTDEQTAKRKAIFESINTFCSQKKFKLIALNVEFKDSKSYLLFKFALSTVFEKIKIAITVFLNKVIEVTEIDDITHILKSYHDSKLGGRNGYERMKNTIQRYFQWPNMSRDIKQFIKNCEICEKSKIDKHTRVPLQISSTATEPFEKIFLDLVGPINPPSLNNNNYIFTCNCDLTKFVIATAIPDATALTTAKTLIHSVILRYGIPKEIVSDNGSNFVSETLREVNKLLRIKRIFTTPYHPRSNQIERYHRSLGNYMKSFIQANQNQWDDYLDYATFCYNITYNTTTGFAPFELIYGYNIKLPNNIIKNDTPIYNYDSYVNEVRTKLKRCHELAHQNIIKRKESNKKYYDRQVKNISLKKNDLVLVLKNKKDSKFDQPYDGPFRVERMVNPVIVQLKKGNKSIRVHLDKIKKAEANYDNNTPPEIK